MSESFSSAASSICFFASSGIADKTCIGSVPSDMPESILTQAAVSGVKAEYEAMDEDLDAI